MLMIFFFAITSLFGILHFVVDGKKWCYTHAFNIWVLCMVWFGGDSFFKIILLLNGVQ